VRNYYRSSPTFYSNDAPSPAVVYDTYDAQPSTTTVVLPSATDEAFHNGLWAARLEAATIVGGVTYLAQNGGATDDEEEARDYGRELRETRELLSELKAEHDANDPLAVAIQTPLSGEYVGASAEDDDGDQDVATHLTFHKDGTVSGWGHDGVDGPYTLVGGRWSTNAERLGGGRVAWIEKYDDGFEVALRGQIRDDGVIRALWASDRGVSGSVELVRRV